MLRIQHALFIVLVVALEACSQHEGSIEWQRLPPATQSGITDDSTSDTTSDTTSTAENDCSRVVDRLQEVCEVPSSEIVSAPECGYYESCQARCLENAPCSLFGHITRAQDGLTPEEYANARKDLNDCSLSCYVNGPATCESAENYLTSCGLTVTDVITPFTQSCDQPDRCMANCIEAAPCVAFTYDNISSSLDFLYCLQLCDGDVPVTLHPSDMTPEDRHCSMYPHAPECSSTYLPFCERPANKGAPWCRNPNYYQQHCSWYPEAPECDNTYTTYCDRYPTDPYCRN